MFNTLSKIIAVSYTAASYGALKVVARLTEVCVDHIDANHDGIDTKTLRMAGELFDISADFVGVQIQMAADHGLRVFWDISTCRGHEAVLADLAAESMVVFNETIPAGYHQKIKHMYVDLYTDMGNKKFGIFDSEFVSRTAEIGAATAMN